MQIFGNAVRFGVQCATSRTEYATYLENWQACERLGYDIAYATDHFVFQEPDGRPVTAFESTTLLAAMASHTSRMRCGFMVLGNTFRNPAIVANIAVTLDHVSDGRFELGIGSGNGRMEHEQYNVPFHTTGRRLRALGEALTIIRSLLTQERTTFEGRYHSVFDATCDPKPVQAHLPILVGAIGEDLALRNVAQGADIWNIYDSPSREVLNHRRAVLAGHCKEIGRDPADIRVSMHVKPLVGESAVEIEERAPSQPRARSRCTPEQLTEELLDYVRLGVGDFVFMLDAPADIRSLELIATRVAPAVREEGARIRASTVS